MSEDNSTLNIEKIINNIDYFNSKCNNINKKLYFNSENNEFKYDVSNLDKIITVQDTELPCSNINEITLPDESKNMKDGLCIYCLRNMKSQSN